MPPLCRNHRAPTAGDTPARTAASSLVKPWAMPAQKRCRSARRATGGRPGDRRGARPDRSARRLRFPIAAPLAEALRRPLEPGQYASAAYVARLQAAGARISMASTGNPYENAQAEAFFKTLKTEEV